jgi:hypothetical protein
LIVISQDILFRPLFEGGQAVDTSPDVVHLFGNNVAAALLSQLL